MKKFLTAMLALMLVLSLATTAFAATVDNKTDHTYDVYQIFSGEQTTAGGATLTEVQWGTGVDSAALLNALKTDNTTKDMFTDAATAADVAKVLADNNNLANAFAALAYQHKATAFTTISGNSTAKDLDAGYYLMVDTSDVNGKEDAKNLALLQLTNNGEFEIQQKYDVPEVEKTLSDPYANVGDTVTFTLTATMPTRLDGYETYKVIFHDTMDAGLTYVGIESVTIDGNATNAFTAQHNNGTLTITCNDVLAAGAQAGNDIVVTYTAKLNANAITGKDGNENKVYLEFSNDPNWTGTGEEPTGDTPEKEVKVYTYVFDAFKYTGENTPLAGAKFQLLNSDKTKTFNLVATANANEYMICNDASCDGTTAHTHITEIVTDTNGTFKFIGLEPGTYYLDETEAPAGYNKITEAIKVEISADENTRVETIKQNDETVTQVKILNNAGTVLPETGGVGTTMLYVAGGLLVAAAVILLVTKKRMAR